MVSGRTVMHLDQELLRGTYELHKRVDLEIQPAPIIFFTVRNSICSFFLYTSAYL